MKSKILYGIILGMTGLVAVWYFAVMPGLAEALFQDKAPVWFSGIVNTFYPRFEVEKHRFDTAFFTDKALQIGYRFLLISLSALLFHYLFYQVQGFRKQVVLFWQNQTSVRNIRILILLFYTGMLFFTADFWFIYKGVYSLKAFYKPVSFLKLLPFPSQFFIICWLAVFYLSCLAVLFRYKPVFFSGISGILFVYFQGLLCGFEKTDHTFTTLAYAAMLMPFLIYTRQKAYNKPLADDWALKLIQLAIGMGYLLAGIEKLLIAGGSWFAAETLRYHLRMHPTVSGLWVAESDWVCILLQTGVMVFQLGFILTVFLPKLKIVFLPMGVLFHFGTVILMNVGGFLTPWLFVYIFFIDWAVVFPRKTSTELS